MNLVLIALAAFYCWTTLRFLLPFVIPDRLALLLYGASTWALADYSLPHGVLLGLAGAGALVLVTVLAKVEAPANWDWVSWADALRPRLPARRKPRMHPQDKPGPGRRIPRI